MNDHWVRNSIYYHIYPLGLCGAPAQNDFHSPPEERLKQIHAWFDHIQALGANAVYLGPVFESSSHGYDTADYYQVDRRLGTHETLACLSDALHARGMRLILDAVFNHVGRDFWAFRDVLQHGQDSAYRDWFHQLRFGECSPYGDPFSYQGWDGHFSLVKLNLLHPHVRQHLFDAAAQWIRSYNIDGLRLDAADCLEPDFMQALARVTLSIKPDFWLMGEVVHGDYRRWANPETLDSVTNYESFKGLYSSLNDHNYFEIAHTLKRQFGEGGLYQDIPLYNFADNHDVNRVASLLNDPAQLFPLYLLLFTMPGVPSIYYGSEWALTGEKHNGSDAALRPALTLDEARTTAPQRDLPAAIARLARLRASSPALYRGNYRELYVSPDQFAFLRETGEERIIIALNASAEPARIELPAGTAAGTLCDTLNGETLAIDGASPILNLPPRWGRVLLLAH